MEKKLYFRSSQLQCSIQKLLRNIKNLCPNLLVKTSSEGVHFNIFREKFIFIFGRPGNERTQDPRSLLKVYRNEM